MNAQSGISPSAHFVNRTVNFVPGVPVVYLNNPKVACSTMKKSLWLASDRMNGVNTFAEKPHDRVASPFSTNLQKLRPHVDEMVRAQFFTVVRNPFARVLSAYLDKLVRHDPVVWRPLSEMLGFKESYRPSFGEFLSQLAKHDNPWIMDRHFTPQHVNILSDYATPDFIGHLEAMPRVESYLNGHGISLEPHTVHRTKSAQKLADFYGSKEIASVVRYYARDFEHFGYSTNPSSLEPTKPHDVPAVDRSVLRELVMNCHL